MAKNLSETDKRFLDKTSEASYGLWNAIITVNGIILSVFSLINLMNYGKRSFLVTIVVVLSCVSMALILLNYISTKFHYLKIGKKLINQDVERDDGKEKNDIEQAYKRHKNIVRREKASLIILLTEIVFVLIIVTIM